MNQAAATGTRPATASPAGDAFRTASAAYSSAAPSAAAVAAAAGTDHRLGSREATKYTVSPSMRPNGNGALPAAMTTAVAVAATASTGNGHRRSATIGPHTKRAGTSPRPGAWERGPTARVSSVSPAPAVNTTEADHCPAR